MEAHLCRCQLGQQLSRPLEWPWCPPEGPLREVAEQPLLLFLVWPPCLRLLLAPAPGRLRLQWSPPLRAPLGCAPPPPRPK